MIITGGILIAAMRNSVQVSDTRNDEQSIAACAIIRQIKSKAVLQP